MTDDDKPEVLEVKDLILEDDATVPDERGLRLASAIVLDHEKKALFIDGIEFPLYMHERGPWVERSEEMEPLCVVNLPIICETFDVIGEPDGTA